MEIFRIVCVIFSRPNQSKDVDFSNSNCHVKQKKKKKEQKRVGFQVQLIAASLSSLQKCLSNKCLLVHSLFRWVWIMHLVIPSLLVFIAIS